MLKSVMTFVYALRRDSPGPWRILQGRGADVHKSLLARCRWLAVFESAPDKFIMGRIRVFPGLHIVVADTVSDLYRGKTGRTSSLPGSVVDARSLLAAVQAEFPDCQAFLLAPPARVPALNEKRLVEALLALSEEPESSGPPALTLQRNATIQRTAE